MAPKTTVIAAAAAAAAQCFLVNLAAMVAQLLCVHGSLLLCTSVPKLQRT
jgi:hypothetical protein